MRKADEERFTAFVEERMDRWRRSAFLLCRDWHTADDLVSTTVTKLFQHWRKVCAADNPDAYAQRILARSWLDERRRPWRREHASDELPDRGLSPDDRVEDHASLEALLDAVGPRQRAVLVLRYYLDFSIEETAEILRIAPGTVKSQAARGLASLRVLSHPPAPVTGRTFHPGRKP
ncbi:SigE family RNA polymerase sigma factor [Cryptosporangium aurantiacum]|uniref:SigE family RNA polymerase sigma factor n=1 Tax=Cryptosporangium aurantiacum TaxID=134849 RepID=UPI001C4A567A|nr:SigE family RNA polymerase sigma factor [Cryptosporangium aurantiacum]